MNYDRIITCLKLFIDEQDRCVKDWYNKGLNEEFGEPAALYFIGLAETAISEIRREKNAATN